MASQGLSALRAKGPAAVAAFATQHKVSAGERAKLEAGVESGSTDGLGEEAAAAFRSEGAASIGQLGGERAGLAGARAGAACGAGRGLESRSSGGQAVVTGTGCPRTPPPGTSLAPPCPLWYMVSTNMPSPQARTRRASRRTRPARGGRH